MSKNIYMRLCKCTWQILTLVLCKCKRFKCVNVNDLHLHEIYMLYVHTIDTYTYNTGVEAPYMLSTEVPSKKPDVGTVLFTYKCFQL
jgi:hypothetical protein